MIEIIKSSEYNARAIKPIDIANKIPGYNFSYPVMNTIEICNILMSGGSIEISIERQGKSKWSYNVDTKELLIEKTKLIEKHIITDTTELINEMDNYFNINQDELWQKAYKTNIKKSISKSGNKNAQQTPCLKEAKSLIDDQGYPLEFCQLGDALNHGGKIRTYYEWVKKNNYLYKLDEESILLLCKYGANIYQDIKEEKER